MSRDDLPSDNTIETAHRRIHTSIPGPGDEDILEKLNRYEARFMRGAVPAWDHASGFSIYDRHGNRWIDFTSGVLFANVGHANPAVIRAVKETLDKQLLHSYSYPTEIRARYLERLIEFCPEHLEKAYLVSSGTETTEAALRLININGQESGKRHLGLIAIETNWHGRTMGASMMCHAPAQNSWLEYRDPNFHHIPFPYPWVLDGKSGEAFLNDSLEILYKKGVDLKTDICGFILESFQGWTCAFYPQEYVEAIKNLCDENKIVLIFDEIQSGFGRTGKKFGYEHYSVEADMICCGKGMSSGFPLSGVIGRAELMDLPRTNSLSSTHSANPVVCAAGLAVLDELERLDLITEAARKGDILFDGLENLKKQYPERIERNMGRGLVAMIYFKKPDSESADPEFAGKVARQCLKTGLLLMSNNTAMVKMAPPLTISDEALLEGISVLEEAIKNSIG